MKKIYKQNANDQIAKFADCLLLLAASKLEPSTTQQSLFMTRITRFECCCEIAYRFPDYIKVRSTLDVKSCSSASLVYFNQPAASLM